LVFDLAASDGPAWRWLADCWATLWFRHYCPYPVIEDRTARACVECGQCGCNNLDRYSPQAATEERG
jgi:hypothetical protein